MLGFVPDAAPSASELTIMNFNTYLLLGPSALVAAKPDYCERAEQIVSALSRLAVDVVVLNEIASRDILCPVDSYTMVVDHLAGPGRPFPYRSQFLNGTPSEGLFGPTSTGGIVILSKHPVETVHHHEFADGAGEDALMQKGFLHVRVTKTMTGQSRVYNVIGTHLQAGGGSSNVAVRRAQRDDIAAYIEGLPANQPILISGDLNTSSGEIPGFLSELDAAHTGFDDIVQYSSSGVQSYYFRFRWLAPRLDRLFLARARPGQHVLALSAHARDPQRSLSGRRSVRSRGRVRLSAVRMMGCRPGAPTA